MLTLKCSNTILIAEYVKCLHVLSPLTAVLSVEHFSEQNSMVGNRRKTPKLCAGACKFGPSK